MMDPERTDPDPTRPASGDGVPSIWRAVLAADAGVVSLAGRLRVTGVVPDRLRGRPLLLAPNHIGVFDPFVLMAACRRIGISPRFMLAAGILDAPLIGPVVRAGGNLRVDRGKAAAVDQFDDAAVALATMTTPLLVYPEGRVSHDPGLWPERGKTGVARLALASGAPVVPVSQWGAHEAVYWGSERVDGPADMLPLALSGLTTPVRRPTFRVHFGDPVDLSEFSAGTPGHAVRAHARIMQAITDGLAPLRRDEPDAPRFHDPTRPTDTRSPWRDHNA